jgi:hypothetical protein
MPGVRYGPDISDDAAHIQNEIVSLLKLEKSRAGKLAKRDRTRLDKLTRLSKDLFGVDERSIRRGRYGDLGLLAQYSGLGRDPRTGKLRKREKLARSKRTGRIMKKDEAKENAERLAGIKSSSGTGGTRGVPGEAALLGRTAPKTFREAEERTWRRARSKGVGYNSQRIPKGVDQAAFKGSLDKLNIARVRKDGQGPSYRDYQRPLKGSLSIRKPMTKSTKDMAARMKREQSKRAKTVATAGKKLAAKSKKSR